MKRLLIPIFILSLAQLPASADNKSYLFFDEDENPAYGVLRRVSPNGIWATGGDETDETGSFLINTTDIENYVHVDDGLMLDVDDNGMVVGTHYQNIGGANYKYAAIYRNGEWEELPLPEEIIGQSYAVAISADSKTIAGHGMCANEAPDEPGKYFPIIWKLNEETGSYELHKLYNNLYLPGTFGFFVEDMTPDATIICGFQTLDVSDFIAAMLNLETGEYKIWHEVEYKETEWQYGGKTYTSEEMFVDGIQDGIDEETFFAGRLCYATDRYLFGSRALVLEANEDGTGLIDNLATVYDMQAERFIDVDTDCILSCGLNADNAFTTQGMAIVDGKFEYTQQLIGTGDPIYVVYGMDDAQRVLVGSHVAYTGWGEPYESPVLVILEDKIFTGINAIKTDKSNASITVNGNTVTVEGADTVEILTADGSLVATSHKVTLPAGIYIVVADGTTKKVAVK